MTTKYSTKSDAKKSIMLPLSNTPVFQNKITPNAPKSINNFIEAFGGLAVETNQNTNVPPSIEIAQAIIESGNGESRLSAVNNHFGIKANKNEDYVTTDTNEDSFVNGVATTNTEKAKFKVFPTPESAFKAHSNLLQKYESQKEIFRNNKSPEITTFMNAYPDIDYETKLFALALCAETIAPRIGINSNNLKNYATSKSNGYLGTEYPFKILNLIRSYKLNRLDK